MMMRAYTQATRLLRPPVRLRLVPDVRSGPRLYQLTAALNLHHLHTIKITITILSLTSCSSARRFFHLPLLFLAADMAHRWLLSARYGLAGHLTRLDDSTLALTLPAARGTRYSPGQEVSARMWIRRKEP